MGLARALRVALASAVLASLSTVGMPAASGSTVGVVEFVGTVVLGCPGLGAPGTPPGTTDLSPNNCPFFFSTNIACTDSIVNVAKPGKPPLVAGAGCNIVAGGTVTGYCGLVYGKGSGSIVDSTGNVVLIPSFSFTSPPGTLVVTGVVSKPSTGQKGFLSGIIEGAPSTPVLTPGEGDCFTKSLRVVVLAGSVLFSLL